MQLVTDAALFFCVQNKIYQIGIVLFWIQNAGPFAPKAIVFINCLPYILHLI